MSLLQDCESDPHDEAKKDESGLPSYVERANEIPRARLQANRPRAQVPWAAVAFWRKRDGNNVEAVFHALQSSADSA